MIALTPEQIDARRVELVQVEEQIRTLGRRKSVLRAEILSGYAAPAKGVPAEQLSLDTSTATTPAKAATEAPAQGKEAAKPATATTTATDRHVKPEKAAKKPAAKVPSKPAPKVKPAAKTSERAPKKAKVKPPLALGDQIYITLREWGTWYDVGHLEAAVRGVMPLNAGPSTRDWNGVLKDMLRSKRIERREVDGRVQFRTAPLPTKKPAVEAPRPTVTVGEAVSKLLAETPPQRWQKVRSLVADRLAGNRGYPIHVADLYLSVDHGSEIDAVMELLEEAGAIHRSLSTVGHKRMVETGAAVDEAVAEDGETSIQGQILALTHAYVLELVAAHPGLPTTDDLAVALELPRGLVLSVLDELRESGALTRGNGGRWQATAQARTLPLIPGVDPAPASEEAPAE